MSFGPLRALAKRCSGSARYRVTGSVTLGCWHPAGAAYLQSGAGRAPTRPPAVRDVRPRLLGLAVAAKRARLAHSRAEVSAFDHADQSTLEPRGGSFHEALRVRQRAPHNRYRWVQSQARRPFPTLWTSHVPAPI